MLFSKYLINFENLFVVLSYPTRIAICSLAINTFALYSPPFFYGERFLLQNFNRGRYALRQHCFVLKICNSKRTKRSHYDP
jgi:hypothetical protein